MLDWLLITMCFMFSCPCRIDPGRSTAKEPDQQATPSRIIVASTPSSKNLAKCVGIFTPGIQSSNWIFSHNIINMFSNWYCATTSNLDPKLCRQGLLWVEPLTNNSANVNETFTKGRCSYRANANFWFWRMGACATCLLGTTSNLARRFEALEQVCNELYTFIPLLTLKLMMLNLSVQTCLHNFR